jgi:hypothetical protein
MDTGIRSSRRMVTNGQFNRPRRIRRLIISLHAPAWAVFLCLKCDQILKCFVAMVVINRFKWIKDLTKG